MLNIGYATNDELFRHNGTLPPERIESLIDMESRVNKLSGIGALIDEARGQFPDEDFLCDVIRDLEELALSMRGEKRRTLEGLIQTLQDRETDAWQSAEYGVEQLRKATADIEDITGE